MPESPYPMIAVEEALELIRHNVPLLPAANVPFAEALGMVLGEDVFADEPMPPFDASAVDGFAVIAEEGPGPRRIVGEQLAGYLANVQVEPGTAVRVMTGAPIPYGADAMVMVEDTQEEEGQVNILVEEIERGAYIRPVGQDIERGQLVLPTGTLLGPPELGLLGTVGRTEVVVHRQPRVAVMSTGDEVVAPQRKPQPGQIRDANRFGLMGALTQLGLEVVDLGIVPDEAESVRAAIAHGLTGADVLLTSGGVSMGQLDLVKPYLAKRGTVHFGRVRSKPGKPVTFATVAGKPCFALPGFPVSALVCFEIYVRPALLKMAGHKDIYRPREQAALAHEIHHTPGRTEFQRVELTRRADGQLVATTTGSQGSGRLLSMVGANGLIVLPAEQADFAAGTKVEALILEQVKVSE